jgi:hypothetical protein
LALEASSPTKTVGEKKVKKAIGVSSESIITTIQQAKMAKRLLQKIDDKRRKLGPEFGWLYTNEALIILKDFSPNSIRSFIDRLSKLNLIQFLPYGINEEKPWGGLFRFTHEGEEAIKKEMHELINY